MRPTHSLNLNKSTILSVNKQGYSETSTQDKKKVKKGFCDCCSDLCNYFSKDSTVSNEKLIDKEETSLDTKKNTFETIELTTKPDKSEKNLFSDTTISPSVKQDKESKDDAIVTESSNKNPWENDSIHSMKLEVEDGSELYGTVGQDEIESLQRDSTDYLKVDELTSCGLLATLKNDGIVVKHIMSSYIPGYSEETSNKKLNNSSKDKPKESKDKLDKDDLKLLPTDELEIKEIIKIIYIPSINKGSKEDSQFATDNLTFLQEKYKNTGIKFEYCSNPGYKSIYIDAKGNYGVRLDKK